MKVLILGRDDQSGGLIKYEGGDIGREEQDRLLQGYDLEVETRMVLRNEPMKDLSETTLVSGNNNYKMKLRISLKCLKRERLIVLCKPYAKKKIE